MKRIVLFAAILFAGGFTVEAEAGWGHRAHQQARIHSQGTPWNGNYSYTPAGEPVALIVPPTASSMAAWSWGVSQSEVRPLYHQYGRSFQSGAGMGGGNPYQPTPHWPSHTDNFGVYPVRAPWR